jgi:hypothetical protein
MYYKKQVDWDLILLIIRCTDITAHDVQILLCMGLGAILPNRKLLMSEIISSYYLRFHMNMFMKITIMWEGGNDQNENISMKNGKKLSL